MSNSLDLAWFVDLLWIFVEICQQVVISQQIHMLEAQSVYQKINFLISQPIHIYVVGTQKNGLKEMVLLSTQNMLKLMGKKILTILRSKVLFIENQNLCGGT